MTTSPGRLVRSVGPLDSRSSAFTEEVIYEVNVLNLDGD